MGWPNIILHTISSADYKQLQKEYKITKQFKLEAHPFPLKVAPFWSQIQSPGWIFNISKDDSYKTSLQPVPAFDHPWWNKTKPHNKTTFHSLIGFSLFTHLIFSLRSSEKSLALSTLKCPSGSSGSFLWSLFLCSQYPANSHHWVTNW